MCLISMTMHDAISYMKTYEKKGQELFISFTAKKFIARSFKNACQGKGFSSPEQWKLSCNALFKLDSITYEKLNNQAFHAEWKALPPFEKCSGEVYCIVKEGD